MTGLVAPSSHRKPEYADEAAQVFIPLDSGNIVAEMKHKNARFIYFFRGSSEERAEVAEFAARMRGYQGLRCYIVDMRRRDSAEELC